MLLYGGPFAMRRLGLRMLATWVCAVVLRGPAVLSQRMKNMQARTPCVTQGSSRADRPSAQSSLKRGMHASHICRYVIYGVMPILIAWRR